MVEDGAAFGRRLVVLGTCGSGKSTLAVRIAATTGQPVLDLDRVHWTDDGRKVDEAVARRQVVAIADGERWIIEGVYGWLTEAALPRATALIWLDLPWPDCRTNLLRRGPQRGEAGQAALLAWAEAYGTRATSSSATGHRRLIEAFAGHRLVLHARSEVDALCARLTGPG